MHLHTLGQQIGGEHSDLFLNRRKPRITNLPTSRRPE